MDGSSENEQRDLWGEYWRDGPLHACTFDFPENARDAIATKWRQTFAALDSGGNILDVATGNGALLAIAAETAITSHSLSAVGVDLAQIDPKRNTELIGASVKGEIDLDFRGGIDAADLPFDDRSFTLVVSQYGIEYADFEAAIAEACRVADKNVKFLVHAADSAVVRQNGQIPEQVDWLRKELGLFDAAREQFTAPTRATGDRLTRISAAIRDKCGALDNPDFLFNASQYIGRLLAQAPTLQTDKALAYLDQMEAQIMGRAERMQALVTAARSTTDLDRAGEICSSAGYEGISVETEYTGTDKQIVGYWLAAARPSGQ